MIFAPQQKLCRHKRFHYFVKGNYITPINIEISLTGKCNASCPECFYRYQKDNGSIHTLRLKKFIDELENVKAITWTGGGEPTLHKDFAEIVDYVDIKQGLFTNALRLPTYDIKKFEWIRISKTNHEWPEKSIEMLSDFNEKIGLCVNYTGNTKDIIDGLRLVRKYNLRYINVRPALKLGQNQTCIDMPSLQDNRLIISNYKFLDSYKGRGYSKCYGYHFAPFVWHDGNYSVCAYQRGNKDYVLGNIYKDTFGDIIENLDRFKSVDGNCQTCCKNHEINKLINGCLDLEDGDFV